MKRNTREFSLCFCVSVSFPLSLFPTPHPLWGVTEKPAWEERVLTRTSPCWHPDLGLLAPRTVRKEFSVYSTESIVLFYGIPSWQIQNHLYGNLKKKMNERKLKKLLHFFYLRFHKTDPFFNFNILWTDGFFDLERVLLQRSCLKDSIPLSLRGSFLLGAWRATVHRVARVGHDLATKPPPP